MISLQYTILDIFIVSLCSLLYPVTCITMTLYYKALIRSKSFFLAIIHENECGDIITRLMCSNNWKPDDHSFTGASPPCT